MYNRDIYNRALDNSARYKRALYNSVLYTKALWCGILVVVGQRQDSKYLIRNSLVPTEAAAKMWLEFRLDAELRAADAPRCARGAIGKHCYTTSSHVIECRHSPLISPERVESQSS